MLVDTTQVFWSICCQDRWNAKTSLFGEEELRRKEEKSIVCFPTFGSKLLDTFHKRLPSWQWIHNLPQNSLLSLRKKVSYYILYFRIGLKYQIIITVKVSWSQNTTRLHLITFKYLWSSNNYIHLWNAFRLFLVHVFSWELWMVLCQHDSNCSWFMFESPLRAITVTMINCNSIRPRAIAENTLQKCGYKW